MEKISKKGLSFPEVEKPKPLFYLFNNKEDEIFNKTIELIVMNLHTLDIYQ